MSFIQAVILGIIEGLTEFLPISSTGHLIIASQFMHLTETEFMKSFQIIIQLAAILAVIIPLRKKLFLNRRTQLNVLYAFLPTGVIGFALYKIIKAYLIGNVMVVAWSLLIGGLILVLFEILARKPGSIDSVEAIPTRTAATIGAIQALAVIPGVSRSAATIVGGRWLGVDRSTIVEFSFLLAVPTMLAAAGLDLLKSGYLFTPSEWGLLLVGSLMSFLTAFISVKFFLRYIKNHTFVAFGIYRILVALVLFAWLH